MFRNPFRLNIVHHDRIEALETGVWTVIIRAAVRGVGSSDGNLIEGYSGDTDGFNVEVVMFGSPQCDSPLYHLLDVP